VFREHLTFSFCCLKYRRTLLHVESGQVRHGATSGTMLIYRSTSSSGSSSSSAGVVFGVGLAGVDTDDGEDLDITDVSLGATADCVVAARGD
jgi:hypothetical protein